jgi:hypothetical protein
MKVIRVLQVKAWIYGDITTGKLGLIREIQQLIDSHAGNEQELPKMKSALSKYGVDTKTPAGKIFEKFWAFFETHIKIIQCISARDEEKVLQACNFLAEIKRELKKAILPDMQEDVADKFIMHIKQLRKIASMRQQAISHALSGLQTPKICDTTDKLLIDDSDYVQTVSVDDRQEWAEICETTLNV